MTNTPTIEGSGNIPASPTLVIPNRLDLPALRALKEALGGNDRVAWMVENTLRPDSEILRYFESNPSMGFLCAIDQTSKENLVNMIRERLVQGRHVVLLCGHPGQQPGTMADVPGKLLSIADGSKLSALPVYVGMYKNSLTEGITNSAPWEREVVQIMQEVKPGPNLGAAVRSAWMEAEAEQLASHPALQSSLRDALLAALVAHPNAMVIDGVDDSQLTYRRLLTYAMIVCDKLRANVSNKRLGILLPPGKLATIANVACILAGIVPVNFNYDLSAAAFRHQVELSGVDRFITENRFIHKQQQFTWPSQRDLIYIDRELAELSPSSLRLRDLAIRFDKIDLCLRHIRRKQLHPSDEALLFFTSGTGGLDKGVPMTNCAALTAIMQMSSRLSISRGQRVLSALPLSQPMGLLCGILLPIMQGMDIVTYPDIRTPRRLCELAHNYSTVLTAFTPAQIQELLDAGRPEHFATLRHFLVTGEKLPTSLAHRAINEFKLMLQECYCLSEATAPVAICAPPPPPAPGTSHIIPAGYAGCVGAPLPGIAVRISDLNKPEKTLPSTATGLIWIKGNTVLQGYLKDKPESTTCMRGKWFCTGDVGKMDADGLLTICGRKARFSKIGEDLVSHVAAEEALARVLGAPQPDGTCRLAIVGVPNPRGGGEILVLLSTLHTTVVPQDLITARYALLNARYPASWAPDRIIPVPSIPLLPNGKLNYPMCYYGVCGQLGIDPSQAPVL